MSDTWFGIIVGAALSIPISVLAPYINRLLDKRSAHAAQVRAERDSRFREFASQLAEHKSALFAYLLEALVRIAYVGAVAGVISGLLFTLGQFVPYMGLVTSYLYGFGQLIAVIGTVVVLDIARKAIQTVREVRSIKEG